MNHHKSFATACGSATLDNFLVEELRCVQTPFANGFFLISLLSSIVRLIVRFVELHKSPQRIQDARQTDVRLGWFNGENLRACVLIESKVTADFQPGQAEAYAQEVMALRAELGTNHACAVLIAPQAKMKTLPKAHHSFRRVSRLKKLVDALTQRRLYGLADGELDARLAVRIELLEALAGKRLSTGWLPVTVESKRDFAKAYTELCQACSAKSECPSVKRWT